MDKSVFDNIMPSETFSVLHVPIAATTVAETVQFLRASAEASRKGYVIFRDVHGVVRCQDDPELLRIHQRALRVCPDGMPLVWIGKRRGHKQTERVYGPDLMRALMEATRDGVQCHYLYGGKEGVADKLKERLESLYPGVRIVGTFTPPFGPLDPESLSKLQTELSTLKPDFFWVGLSTPKQEVFMDEFLVTLDVKIMLGVGAAFDYLSGTVPEPPVWIRKRGLQWFYRICQEPGRLAGRYLCTIPRFLYLYLKDQYGSNRERD
jgi:N-acetylglucosaminyldiphosphoundecaprenol N-acetyl-beta-D-mannosaminyltransferase